MASEKVRVLFRYYAGLPMRQASEGERQSLMEAWEQLCKDWTTLGVKLCASFSGLSNPGGFCHYIIFEVDDLELMKKMNGDVLGGTVGKLAERYDFSVGTGMFEDSWQRWSE